MSEPTRRIVIISDCEDCPYFYHEYWGWEHECQKLDRVIPYQDEGISFPIPDDCPLERAP
jgi:hypothetical protein